MPRDVEKIIRNELPGILKITNVRLSLLKVTIKFLLLCHI